jgi:hypothetical protein
VPSSLNSQTKKRKERPTNLDVVASLTVENEVGDEDQLSSAIATQPVILPNTFRLEGDNSEKRATYDWEKLAEAVDFVEALQACRNINYDVLYGHFNYESYYDTNFLCALADAICIDISEVTCKRRYTRKELLDCIVKKIIN